MYFINNSRTLAKHVGAEIIIPRPLVGREVKRRVIDGDRFDFTQRPGEISFFRYHPNPVFPSQELGFIRFWIGIHKNNLARLKANASIRWRIYADDAEPVEGENVLIHYTQVQRAIELLERKK